MLATTYLIKHNFSVGTVMEFNNLPEFTNRYLLMTVPNIKIFSELLTRQYKTNSSLSQKHSTIC